MRLFSFKYLWRVNAIIIFLLGLCGIAISFLALSQMFRNSQYDFEVAGSEFGSELVKSNITGGKVGSIVVYTTVVSQYDFPNEGRDDATFVNLSTGQSMNLLSEGSEEKIVWWEMLKMTIDGVDQGIGYVAMKAVEPDFSVGSADIEVGTFSDMTRFTIASNVQEMDAAQMINEQNFSIVLSSDRDRVDLLVVDLVDQKVTKRMPLKLPKS